MTRTGETGAVAGVQAATGGALPPGPATMRATYRVQFNDDFTFADAARLAPYLADLGISHLYASPIFAARSGSAHGYDMVDPGVISAALGGEAGFRVLAARLAEAGIGIVLDIVPNHMAADPANPFWMDVLEFGPDAKWAPVFDIDFSRRIALPWLEEGAAPIERLAYDIEGGRVVAIVAGQGVPLAPGGVAALLERIGAGEAAEHWRAIDRCEADPALIAAARTVLREAVAAMGESFERALAGADLDAVHAVQHWQAVPWRQIEALNYRRFFEVSHLLGVRIEDASVFEMVHRLPLALLREGLVQGLRVDHVDGLADPGGYLTRLRAEAGPEALILVEKILGPQEALRDWPIDGTTGYERLNLINAAFVAPAGRTAFQDYLATRGWISGSPLARIASAKAEVIETGFKPELANLVASAAAALGPEAPARSELQASLVALLAAFPVYRSYVASLPAAAEDVALWQQAAQRVAVDASALAPVADRLMAAVLSDSSQEAARFRRLFQQLSGPAMAKGFEDTELYRSVGLASVNEVGSDLVDAAPEAAALHHAFAAFGNRGLTPLATHDTKRGADTRARINLLSHHAARWIGLVEGWQARHQGWKRNGAPDGLDEWLIYQTLFGAWPIDAERAQLYFEKAMREAKRHSGWTDPATDYEAALHAFTATLIDGKDGAPFRAEMDAFIAELEPAAAANSLAQAVLQLTVPGIPDLYRGTELADFSLVDPDNRRPVDWQRRATLLAAGTALPPLADDRERSAKMLATRALLALRARAPGLFDGAYRPQPLAEPGWFAFTREGREGQLLVALPVMPEALKHTRLRFDDIGLSGTWQDVLGGGETEIAEGSAPVDRAVPLLVLHRLLA